MAHLYAEIKYDSRSSTITKTSIEQKLVVLLCIDDSIETTYSSAGFFKPSGSDADDDDVAVLEYAYTIIPETRLFPDYYGVLQLLTLDRVQIDQKTDTTWLVTADYKFDNNTGTGGQQSENEKSLPYVKVGFKVGGGEQTIKRSGGAISNVSRINGNMPNDLHDETLIGYTPDGIEGVSVPSSSIELQVTVYYLPTFFDQTFINTIHDIQQGPYNRGSYNDDTFLDRPEGEIQLKHASGSATVVDVIPITFTFSVKRNITNQIDPGFPNLTMLGHNVLDYRYIDAIDGNAGIRIISPERRIIHQVADPMDYGELAFPDLS